MDPTTAILITLIAYKVVLLGLGFWAQRRTVDTADFYLGGRKLGPWVSAISASAISASASSSSAWTLLGVSGFAYQKGLSALWLIPACCGGFALNWFFVAPRLLRQRGEAVTTLDWLAGPAGSPGRRSLLVTGALITLASFLVYVASQFGAAGTTFEETFDLDRTTSISIGGAIVLVYTLLGGFWAVSVTDTLQGLMMAATALLVPIAALVHVGGPGALADGLAEIDVAHFTSLFGAWEGAAALGFVIGIFGIGIGYPGQPHVVNRFMALRDDAALRSGRRIAMTWALVTYSGMILLGLCARLFLELPQGEHEEAMIATTAELFSPVVAGVIIAAVLSAIMSTADSQLLVCASSITEDLGLARNATPRRRLALSRLTVLVLTVGAVLLALTLSKDVFGNVLFAWSALGAAFGPLLVVRLLRPGPVAPGYALTAMLTGFTLAVAAHLLRKEDWISGTAVESRVLPIAIALAIAWAGTTRSTAPK